MAEGARASGIEKLETAECWRLLETTSFGRLAVINADGTPDIFPVNFVPHEGSLYVRTARDAKLLHIAQHPAVAFEVDDHDEHVRWSVVVRGDAERVTRDGEIRDSGTPHRCRARACGRVHAPTVPCRTCDLQARSTRLHPCLGDTRRLVRFRIQRWRLRASSGESPSPRRCSLRGDRPRPHGRVWPTLHRPGAQDRRARGHPARLGPRRRSAPRGPCARIPAGPAPCRASARPNRR